MMIKQMDEEFLKAIAESPDSWQMVAARHALTIMRLRAALTRIDQESDCDHAAKIAQEALTHEQATDAKP